MRLSEDPNLERKSQEYQARIGNDSQSLIIGPRENDYVSVSMRSDDIQFRIKTYLYNDAPRLVQFFQELAENWQGWSGTRSWKSIESDFKVEAIHDGLRQVVFTISLIKNQGEDNESRYVGKLLLDLGALGPVAAEVKKALV